MVPASVASSRATSTMSCFTDSGVDLLSPDRQCRSEADTELIASVGHWTKNVVVVADQSPIQSDTEVWILLQASQAFFVAIPLDFPGQAA